MPVVSAGRAIDVGGHDPGCTWPVIAVDSIRLMSAGASSHSHAGKSDVESRNHNGTRVVRALREMVTESRLEFDDDVVSPYPTPLGSCCTERRRPRTSTSLWCQYRYSPTRPDGRLRGVVTNRNRPSTSCGPFPWCRPDPSGSPNSYPPGWWKARGRGCRVVHVVERPSSAQYVRMSPAMSTARWRDGTVVASLPGR